MKGVEILFNFEQQIGVADKPLEKPITDDSLYWINQAIDKFTKLRFNGDPVHHTSFEQTEKRRSDLIKLFTRKELTVDSTESYNLYESYSYTYPNDFLYATDECVEISDKDGGHVMEVGVFECTRDSFMYRVNNSLTDFHYRFHRARPLRVRTSTGCELLTDGKYEIHKYVLGYLRKPTELTSKILKDEYEDFGESAINEIVKLAAQMYIENTKNERYQTMSQEVLTQE